MSLEDEHAHHGEVTDEELKEILEKHQKWLDTDGKEGQRANLSNVVDLMGGRLAGANLAGATMPPHLRRFRELVHVDQTVLIARPIYLILLLVCVYTIITIFSTDDIGIITNSKLELLPDVALGIPISGFFIIFPMLLFVFYIYLHLYLYRMWQILGGLPSVFHDGTPLDQSISPWLSTAFVRFYQKCGVEEPSMLGVSQRWVTVVLVWWTVPITLMLLWARYLVRHDWSVTTLHVVLVALSVWSGVILYKFAVAGLCRLTSPFRGIRGIMSSLVLLMSIGVVFVVLSFSAFEDTRKEFFANDPRTWVSSALGLLGMRPSPDLTQLDLQDEENKALKKALRGMDLRGALLVDAELKDADLSHTDLRWADFSNADLIGATLNFANLADAALWEADIQKADFSNSILKGALLNNAAAGGAKFRGSNLEGAKLNGANLVGSIFSNAVLRNADLSDADLREAHFLRADLSEADLGLAKLKGANLFGASLRGADLLGSVLDNVDLRESTGLTQNQLDQACGENVRGLSNGLTILPCPQSK